MTNPAPLSVDPEQLAAAGGELLQSAADLPLAPAPFMPVGTDPLSMAIIGQIPAVEGPVMTELPAVQAQSTLTANNVVNAAQAYAATDQQLGGQIGTEMQNPPSAAGLGSGGAAGSAAGSSTGSAGGSMSQMMSMPMQMAQMPMQMMGAVAAVPQGIMQGAQQVGQQVQQMAGQFGGGELPKANQEGAAPSEARAPETEEKTAAAAGDPGAERAPEVKEKPGTDSGTAPPGWHRAPEPTDGRINL